MNSFSELDLALKSANMLPRRCILILLMISGVEPNPGPGSSSSEDEDSPANEEIYRRQPIISEDGNAESCTVETSNTLRGYKAQYEQFRKFQSRIDTFTNWPSHLKQRPTEMAVAGWFYTGDGDECICFACGGGLTNWQQEDDPWIEHCQFKECPYLRETKGDDFINRHQQIPTARQTEPNQVAYDHIPDEVPVPNHCKHLHCDTQEDQNSDVGNIATAAMEQEGAIGPGQGENDAPHHSTASHQYDFGCDDVGNRDENRNGNHVDVALSPTEQNNIDDPNLDSAQLIEPERNLYGNLQRRFTCRICHINRVNALFLLCRHLMFCMECTLYVDECPFCDTPILERIRTFMTG
ncbi:baculoviral IAP repeat-containing protein 7-A-like isoform X2 [Dreissena polymorpha]|uniref:baculoviral IAP repeat-containing protein 7-A-like isoform X2 n=1 Tax=Dreissena polymorpha TaxID=45954 RepID=UPI0022652450|nr:baculoviral IAP repeat-containing protein 7-A-like isoform X2 [Dreissena polymorpha]